DVSLALHSFPTLRSSVLDRAVGAQTRVSAGPGWTSFVLDVPEGVVDPFVIMRLYVPAGTAIDVAGLRLTVSEGGPARAPPATRRSEEHTSELQSRENLVC